MKSLSLYVKHNNWEKLEENIQMVTENNFNTLITTSVIYHCKECFDILNKLPNRIKWINKERTHWKLRKIFENYAYGPNKSNEYYLVKIFEIMEYIDVHIIKTLLVNKNIFHMVFARLVKNKQSITALINKIIDKDDVEAFMLIHNFLLDNTEQYPFYSNGFVIDTVLFFAICYNATNIVKKLHGLGYNLSKVKYQGQDVSTLLLTLSQGYTSDSDTMFKFLYEKYPQLTQNILWCNWFTDGWGLNYGYYLALNFDWEPTVDFTKLANDYNQDNDGQQQMGALTQDNLILEFQTIINEMLDQEGNYLESYYYFQTMMNTLDYLIGLTPEHPEITQYLKTILVLPGIDLMQIICSMVNGSLKSLNTSSSSHYKNYRRTRRLIMRSRRVRIAGEILESVFNIVRFMKTHKLGDFNPLQLEYFADNITKGKQYSKLILAHLMHMGFAVSDEFRKSVVEKVFNKTELKSLETTIKLLKAENFAKELKAIGKPKKTAKKRTSKKRVQVPAMDDSDDLVSDIEPEPESEPDEIEV